MKDLDIIWIALAYAINTIVSLKIIVTEKNGTT